jgi:Domain of unknown function (DUF4214)
MTSRPRFSRRLAAAALFFACLLCASAVFLGRRASAQSTETWVAFIPNAQQTELDILSCGGRTFADVKITFNNGGFRVTDWGQPARVGGDFSVDLKAERWTGPSVQMITIVEHVYDLGTLAPGAYSFTVNSRATFVTSRQFLVGSSATSNPADDASVFVWQHYEDFLGRDPDAQGFGFWTRNITFACADAACVERKRVDTSAAFFLSIEFQRTGFLVYRLYRASYGRAPRRAEFLPDARAVSRGVVVNASGWEAALEANTTAFLDEWVARPEFKSAYDQLTDAQFVDRLSTNASVTLDAAAREQMLSDLASGKQTRAGVLRSIADDAAFQQREFDRAFVLMQYFGYLQRDPDAAPDSNLDGYNFWLSKLEQFQGDYVRAEMVKAFINSAEYRARFCGQ